VPTTTHAIIVRNQKYPYSITPKRGTKIAKVVCDAANIKQDFELEDIPALLLDLPALIQEEQAYRAKHDTVLRFRVGMAEREKIAKRAREQGQTISEYLRKRALA